MEILINFGGFYHSVHSDLIDHAIERDLEWGDDIDEEGYDKVNWKSTYNDYGAEYLGRLNNHLDLELEFNAIHSPKYYNFTTDKIIANVGDVDEQRLCDYIEDEDFLTWADPQLRSRDGFHSFYNGINDLINQAKDNKEEHELLIGMVIDYLIFRDSINEEIYDLEYEVIYND